MLYCGSEFGGSEGMLSQKTFKIRILKLAKNEFHNTKFPDFSGKFADF